jgi:hypothetical protein
MPQLTRAIADYVAAANSGDADAFGDCFADDATVRDEGHTYRGLTAIKDWNAMSKAKYQAVMTPLKSVERDGRTFVTNRLEGNFPGSPVEVDFAFSLAADKISLLEIGV